ncbi:MAG: rhomboid family intramembrane serine protease [Rhizobiaceae bacterium]
MLEADEEIREPEKQPVFNVPGIILWFLGLMLAFHIVRIMLEGSEAGLWMLFTFAFVPLRYAQGLSSLFSDPAAFWSPVTYSFLHGDWTHILVNSVWLLAFGSVVARRLGAIHFVTFCITGSIFGAFAHFLSHSDSIIPMIGASAVVSACMGAAIRFAFPRNGNFSHRVHDLPTQSLLQSFQNRQVIVFTTLWFAINFLFGIGGEFITGQGQSIAWEAHVGGFLFGLLLFDVFDRKPVNPH